MIIGVLLTCLLAPFIIATPNYPNLTLPWGTWQAKPLGSNTEIYVFQNVRFGGVPTRFGSSSYPAPIPDNSTLQDDSYGPSCIQVDIRRLKDPPGDKIFFGSSELRPEVADLQQSEDCLFLDIYVPASAFQADAPKLPVVVWFYGGGYVAGSKLPFGPDWPFYTGQGLLESSNNNLIFVAGNYRLGAFGWLAGSYMERNGLPNAGLHDQRLLLQWVQKFISKVNGNPSDVGAWGESAGGGSILHHLIQKGGSRDPLFSRALLQSPAFRWQWDREGMLNEVYQNFSDLAGCGSSFNISCLRHTSTESLIEANQALCERVALGPSVDGAWMEALPAVSFAKDAYWHHLQSIVISHVGNETGRMIPKDVVSDPTFEQFLRNFMPQAELSGVRTDILKKYDCHKSPYNGNYRLCVSTLIRDSTFTCNTRNLYDAYQGKAYVMQYSFPAGGPLNLPEALHGTDLIPTFANSDTNLVTLLKLFGSLTPKEAKEAAHLIRGLKLNYQKYLASYGVYGNPNTAKGFGALRWDFAEGTGDKIQKVLKTRFALPSAHPYFEITEDAMNAKSSCDFWDDVAKNISSIMKRTGSKGSLVVQKPEL